MADEYKPKLKWVRYLPDRTDPNTGKQYEDFITHVDGHYAGRIQRITHGPRKDDWRWAGGWPANFRGRPISPNAGCESTAREACRKAEEYWQAMLDQAQN